MYKEKTIEQNRKVNLTSEKDDHLLLGFFNELKELLQCPVTLETFKEPFVSPSGNTIEKKVMKNLIRTRSLDPLTNKEL